MNNEQTQSNQPHVLPLSTYFGVFAALMALLALTIGASYLQLGTGLNTIIAMVIALAKATLVVLFFMHARYGSKLVWLWAGIGFLWLVIMFVITLAEYATRTQVTGW